VIVRSIEHVNSANDCIDSDRKPQKDEANAWPTLREAGKESLQQMPPRGTKRANKEINFFRRKLDPQIECFSGTTR
jgi:hypothetical protein